jgi:two-component system, NarL family, response regulator DesR
MIAVLLVNRHQVVRDGLASLLDAQDDVKVVDQLGFGTKVISAARELRPDVVVLEADAPLDDGLHVAAELRSTVPCRPILVLADSGSPSTVRRAMELRVDGFLLKSCTAERFVGSVRAVAGGQRVIDPELALVALDLVDCPLTARERDLLRLWAQSLTPREIASRLCLSPGTVRNYLAAAVGKLNARNRVDAVRIARDANWI